ncbi:hypothetical protein BGX21_008199 [Mortierella sp. AD011]|nr:hypothetical protein BGX20_007595 [Mortierella sp. AD010]KAF9402903.1 hypothetical protein BGX21_008199 [Mortierella sp. AD011]
MSALTRIPGIAQLASFFAATFSIRTNPTLRRYNDVLSQAFFHHGRLCASNQATVMVLVIVFVGIISYPGIITSYNSSTYARQRSAMTSHSIRNLSLSSWPTAEPQQPTGGRLKHHHYKFEGNLDSFWAHKVIGPTWTQDPDIFNRNLPSIEPLHFIAPVIINATDLLSNSDSHSPTPDAAEAPVSISVTDLLTFSSYIQRRIESIVVEYIPEDKPQSDIDKRAGKELPKAQRLVSLRDICVPEPSGAGDGNNFEDGGLDGNPTSEYNCLVHSPLSYWGNDLDNIRTDPHLRDTIHRHRTNASSSILFGDISFEGRVLEEHSQASLVIAYFLRGDLGKRGRQSRRRSGSTEDEGAIGTPLDVKRVWQLIFNKLATELQLELVKQDTTDINHGLHDSLSVVAEDAVPIGLALPSLERDSNVNEDKPVEVLDGSPLTSSESPFMIRVFPAADSSQSVSRRLVTEESAQPRTNISAEYWLLAMAYFVMFLYISLSVGRVDLVKSKYGLGIAAVVTVFVSLLMSIGVCSVLGVTLTLMPWEILPFMIIVVGVENINILVHAVVETSMDLPVKERVGRGLGAVGVSITLTLVAELCLLVIGAMTTIPAVQEFCTFAIAAVLMDYVLQMTFFITVISIDIRRLELSDLSSRPIAPYSRYPFGSRHSSMKGGHVATENDPSRFGGSQSPNVSFKYEDERARRRNSTSSVNSDGEAVSSKKRAKPNRKGRIFTSFIMVGVMAYLGYIYGTTNQSIVGDHIPVTVSYWRLLSSESSSDFWKIVDPWETGGYLEIEAPAVIVLTKPSNASYETCSGLPDTFEEEECEGQHDGTPASQASTDSGNVVVSDGQLDPRRPFKLLRDALVFVCLFAVWLIRVFVIPSIILAAAILLLLSYLLSPQRKLLVDLQWRFPFIVLPGDYQSKRKLMMQELMAQEARELGQDPGPCVPLPGAVETLHQKGHRTDIDQMDISLDDGLIITSSMDGVVLVWDGMAGYERDTPLAQLEEGDLEIRNGSTATFKGQSRSHKAKNRPVKILKVDPSGEYAIAGYGDGGIHVWRLNSVLHQYEAHWDDRVIKLKSTLKLMRKPEIAPTDESKLKVGFACFWELPTTEGPMSMERSQLVLLVGYRDGQIWQWDLATGRGFCVIESKHRGGVAEMAITKLDAKTTLELGLSLKTYLIVAGKDGGIQCWSKNEKGAGVQDIWLFLWGHTGSVNSVGISSLTLNAEVPMVAAGYSNGAIKIWDLEQGNLVWTLSRGSLSTTGLSPTNHLDRGFSQGPMDNHQPSHQGAITKLCFHALELEDGFTGEPAPRVWLVVSSSVDETVMVWMVEWEGLMCMPSDHHARLEFDSTTGQANMSSPINSAVSSPSMDRPTRSPRTRSFLGDSSAGLTSLLGSLSSSLPAPRLVGFMKQRGGKSMAVSNSCLYGVRRTESSTKHVNERHGRLPNQSHTSVLDSIGPGSNFIRRRKAEPHAPTVAATHDQSVLGGSSMKRGWELWEADLYQCIFKDPGVWGLDLAVRTINLQSSQPEKVHLPVPQSLGLERRSNRHAFTKGADNTGVGVTPFTINSNGSAMAVPVNHDSATLASQDVRPKLQRKPGSYSYQSAQRGYVFATTPTQSSRPDITRNDSQLDGDQLGLETAEPFLLPFVETRLVQALPRRTIIQSDSDHAEQGRELDIKDIVVGFGNFVKIVRLQDDDGDEDLAS